MMNQVHTTGLPFLETIVPSFQNCFRQGFLLLPAEGILADVAGE